MNNVKYIVVDGCMIIFSGAMKHSDFKHFNITSAGFINITNNVAICYGESTSLHIKSNPEKDSRLANSQILKH